jgi:hypothetical protein
MVIYWLANWKSFQFACIRSVSIFTWHASYLSGQRGSSFADDLRGLTRLNFVALTTVSLKNCWSRDCGQFIVYFKSIKRGSMDTVKISNAWLRIIKLINPNSKLNSWNWLSPTDTVFDGHFTVGGALWTPSTLLITSLKSSIPVTIRITHAGDKNGGNSWRNRKIAFLVDVILTIGSCYCCCSLRSRSIFGRLFDNPKQHVLFTSQFITRSESRSTLWYQILHFVTTLVQTLNGILPQGILYPHAEL